MKIKDIMQKDLVALKSNEKVKEAILKLLKSSLDALPVLNERQEIVGIFTIKDILDKILPSYVERIGTFSYKENPKYVNKKLNTLKELNVSDVMSKDIVTVNEETGLCETTRIILIYNISCIPVVDKENKLVGIVSPRDILDAYLRETG